MIAGKKYKGPGADTWSLGVILFALVCGYLPFEDPNTSNLYRKILSGEYKTPKWISPEVKDLIRKILETKPEKRLTIAKIREHVWMRSVPVDSVPRDEAHDEEEASIVKNIVTQRLSDEKVDVQAVMDAVSSHACNALSAFYYLLTQKELAKYRERKSSGQLGSNDHLKNIPSSRTEISQASSTKPESSSASDKHHQHNHQHQHVTEPLAPIPTQNISTDPNIQVDTSKDATPLTDPSHMVPIVSPDRVHNPTEPVVLKKTPDLHKIPRLDLGKTQELRIEGTLQSQTARPPNQNSPMAKNKPMVAPLPSKATSTSGAQSARPVLYEESPAISDKENKTTEEINKKQEPEPEPAMTGNLADFFPKDLSPDKPDQLNANNNFNADDPAEERPTTRRSRSRRGESECGNFNGDGPGAGKIEYEDTKKLTDRQVPLLSGGNNSSANKEATGMLQPVVPTQPQRSSNVSSRGTNRRGRNLLKVEHNPNSSHRGEQSPALNAHVTHMAPIGRPPSGSRSGSRNASFRQQKHQQQQQQQGQGTKLVIQPVLPDTKRGSSGGGGGFSGSSAREIASKNKQRQNGGYNIISGGKTTKTGMV
jgi:hypothetical protein